MAFHRGPKIVTDELVLYLDAANTKSYPGSGNVWNDIISANTSVSLTDSNNKIARFIREKTISLPR
jgi:hypothetical protein